MGLGSWTEFLPYRTGAWIVSGLRHSVTVDLSAAPGDLKIEWFNPNTGETITGGATLGGSKQNFTAPFPSDAILFLSAR